MARLGTDSKQSKRALDVFGMVIEANEAWMEEAYVSGTKGLRRITLGKGY